MTRPLLVLLAIGLAFAGCKTDTSPKNVNTALQLVQGETMGTYYRITYTGQEVADLKSSLDSLLVALNMEVSTYIPSSTISRFNYGDLQTLNARDLQAVPHFLANLELSLEVASATKQYYNITIMPLVNYWGFGYTSKKPITSVDSSQVDSLMAFVGMDKISYQAHADSPLEKAFTGTQIDFSAVAKGYGVDLVAQYLQQRGIQNYLVDIGGESVARGDKGSPENIWRVGINTPREEAALNEIEAAVPLRNQGIATSGNYRNVYEVDGQKYSHTINPFTGYPERSRLLSTSILAADCATADAYATACMVMGLDRAFALIDSLPALEAYFIFSDEQGLLHTKTTDGFEFE